MLGVITQFEAIQTSPSTIISYSNFPNDATKEKLAPKLKLFPIFDFSLSSVY